MYDLEISLYPGEAADILEAFFSDPSLGVRLVDRYRRNVEGNELMVMIFEKYYVRMSGRASLTITMDDMSGSTFLHAISSGGGRYAQNNIDWGATKEFVSLVPAALKGYILSELG